MGHLIVHSLWKPDEYSSPKPAFRQDIADLTPLRSSPKRSIVCEGRSVRLWQATAGPRCVHRGSLCVLCASAVTPLFRLPAQPSRRSALGNRPSLARNRCASVRQRARSSGRRRSPWSGVLGTVRPTRSRRRRIGVGSGVGVRSSLVLPRGRGDRRSSTGSGSDRRAASWGSRRSRRVRDRCRGSSLPAGARVRR